MIRSVLLNRCKPLVLLLAAGALLAFKMAPDVVEMLNWSNRCLMQVYDQSADVKLKKLELSINDSYFLRLRKTYQNGKQEYFSFKIHSFDDLDYIGTTAAGFLNFHTKADNIIVQTYNDRKGDVDSMATTLSIPVKNMQPEQVDSLRNAMIFFRDEAIGR